jgi:hypothetical protein
LSEGNTPLLLRNQPELYVTGQLSRVRTVGQAMLQ